MRRLAILGSFLAAVMYWRRRRSGPFLPRASVKDIMIADPVTIEPAATLAQAAQAMRAGNVGILPVVDGGELRGVITDRDLVVRSMAVGANPSTVHVGDVATAPVVAAHPGWSIGKATRAMAANQVGRLPVVDGNRRLVGIVTLSSRALRAGKDMDTVETARRVARRSARAA